MSANSPPRGDDTSPLLERETAYTVEAKLDCGPSDQLVVDSSASLHQSLGQSNFDRTALKNGGFIDLNDVTPASDMTINADTVNGKPYIVAMMTLEGLLSVSFPGTDRYVLSPAQGCIFRFIDGPGIFELTGGKTVRSLGVSLEPDIFLRYLDNEIPPVLAPLLAPPLCGNVAMSFPISHAMYQTVSSSLAPGLTGALRHIQLEGAALTYISMIVRVLENGAERSGGDLIDKEREAGRKTFERLTASLSTPPSLSELSEAAGITEKRLNEIFRTLYGGTVFEVLRARRLDQAREMIEQGAISIKEIAWNVGYAHVSNFSTAFMAKFGLPPASYAKSHTAGSGNASPENQPEHNDDPYNPI